jgi:hypothetical protein
MNQDRAEWITYAIGAIVLAVVAVLFGMGLLPDRAAASGRGVLMPWLLTWAMIWMTVASGIVLAGFLVVTGGGRVKG